VEWNECADKAAKSAARNETTSYNYESTSLKAKSRELKKIVLNDWAKEFIKYENAWLKTFIKEVSYTTLKPGAVEAPEVMWMITGHGLFGAYLNRMKCKESSRCPCPLDEEQTPEHLLWNCDLVSESKHVIKLRKKIISSNSDLLGLYKDDFVKACRDICKKIGYMNASKLAC